MMTLFEFLKGEYSWLIFALALGSVSSVIGFLQLGISLGRKVKLSLSIGLFYFLLISSVKVFDYYTTYKPNYKMCHDEVALQHGWKMQGAYCYRPVKSVEYVKVKDNLPTQEDLK